MDIKNNRNDGVKFILAIVLTVIMIGLFGQIARGQNYENADSVGLVFVDSLVQVYFEFRQENGGVNAIYTEPLDSTTAANFIFNTAVQGGQIIYNATLQQMQSGRITRMTSDISDALVALTGQNYRNRAERQFINNLTPNCDSLGACLGYFTFKQPGQPDKILRIRDNAQVREVNAQGNNVQGGLQGNVRFIAGTNLLEIPFTAGSLNGTTVYLALVDQGRGGRQRWRSGDRVFTLIQRKALADTQAASALGK